MHRRLFVQSVTGTICATALSDLPLVGCMSPTSPGPMTINDVIDLITKSVPGAPFSHTVDTIKAGDGKQPVKGIVTTMFATIDVIEQAAKQGANFIIAHEPTYYNHLDETSWLSKDAVYQYKRDLLAKQNITVWRCHDTIHEHQPDGVYAGILPTLGWQATDETHPGRIVIAPSSLQSIIDLAKEKLGIEHLRYIGDPAQQCSRISLMVGAAGGKAQIGALSEEMPDLLMVGELVEWETLEYVRDLRASGSKTALIILGHIPSEEPGMQWLADWLKRQLKDIPVTHIPTGTVVKWA